MPIKVACACGAAFAAKDELAGRTVACPKCKQPLKIPAPQATPVAAAPHANDDLFDGMGMKARDTNVPRCPGCAAEMPPNAILCVKCGYNTKLGRRMQTISMSGPGAAAVVGGGGHGGDATAMLMARAAQTAEDDEEAERSKSKEGMPLWVLLVGLFACVLFGVVMSLIPQATALGGTGLILLFAGMLLQFYSWVGVIVTAGQKNPLFALGIFFGDIVLAIGLFFLGVLLTWMTEMNMMGLARLLTGAVWLTYAYLHSEECGQYIMFFWLSIGLQTVSVVLLIVAGLVYAASTDDATGQVPSPPQQPHIAVMELADPLPFCTSRQPNPATVI